MSASYGIITVHQNTIGGSLAMEFVNGKWRWTEEERDKKREDNKKLIWITDGVTATRHPKDQPIPDGWNPGRPKTGKPSWNAGIPQTEESNKLRRQAMLGRPSGNKGHTSPKKGLTEVEYFGEDKAKELWELRSKANTGKVPWNEGIPRTAEEKKNISESKICSFPVEHNDPPQSWERTQWSKAVRKRDSYTCQHCGIYREKGLNTHHIKDWDNFPELRFIISNGLTLCCRCHNNLENTIRILEYNKITPLTMFVCEFKVCSICHRLSTSTILSNVKSCKCQLAVTM
jgi:5-methylcytosine-specific restriction endonuclease McrA